MTNAKIIPPHTITDLAGLHLFVNPSGILANRFLLLQEIIALLNKPPQGVVLPVKLLHLVQQLRN